MLALGMTSNKLLMWDWSTAITSYTFGSNSMYSNAIFLKDGRLAGQTDVSTVNIWNVTSGTVDLSLYCTAYAIEEIYNGLLATSGADSTLKVWNISSSGTLVKTIFLSWTVSFIKQLVKSKLLITGGEDGYLVIYNPHNDFALYNTLTGHTTRINVIEELPNGNFLTCSSGSTVRLWNVDSQYELSSQSPFLNPFYAMKMISQDTFILGGMSNLIYLLNVNNANELVLNTSLPIPGTATTLLDIKVTNTDLVMISYDDYTLVLYNRTNMNFIKSYTIGTTSTGYINNFSVSSKLC